MRQIDKTMMAVNFVFGVTMILLTLIELGV
jgi:hypothetical protein